MQELFQNVLQMSLTASLIALAVMTVRLLFRKAPRWSFCLLWGLVALRLVCPVSVESGLSLVPERVATGQLISNVAEIPLRDERVLSAPENVTETIPNGGEVFHEYAVLHQPAVTVGGKVFPVLGWIWLAGMLGMLSYSGIRYLALKQKMTEATLLRENVWQSEMADMPFVLGFLRPRIYLPYYISEGDIAPVIAHEKAHILRKDHWWKPLGFLLLSIHWFNPVLWAAYLFLCRDIESACDEKVIRHMEKEEKQAYSMALLHCSVHRRGIAACPLAFGEVGVKERVKNVMHFKKPGFWMVLIALVVCVAVGVCFLTDPIADDDVLEYRISSEVTGTQPTDFLSAYNTQDTGILVTIHFEATEGPSIIQIVHGTKKSGGEGWSYSEPVTLVLGESTSFAVPADHHFAVSAASLDQENGQVTFGIREQDQKRGAPDGTEMPPQLTLGQVIQLSQKGDDLTWDDFREYPHEDIGSGLFIWHFELDERFCLQVIGGSTDTKPFQIRLGVSGETEDWVDIREGDVTGYLENHRENRIEMVPTDSRNTGIFDHYLYLTFDGEKYRYERQETMPVGIQAGVQFDTVYEDDGLGSRYSYRVYPVVNCTDNSMVLVHSEDMDMMWLYRYSPAKAVDPEALQRAKDAGFVVLEDGDPTHGQELWQTFYEASQQGTPASVTVAHYYTLDPERCTEQYYEAYKEDYPRLYLYELSFDGETYRVQTDDMDREYEYLMRYSETLTGKTEYVLTHDNRVTWEQLFQSVASSQFGAYIDHCTVYSESES